MFTIAAVLAVTTSNGRRLLAQPPSAASSKKGTKSSRNQRPAPPTPIPSALHAASIEPNDSNSYFAVVGSFQTAKGAMQHIREIRSADLSADVAIYPPYYRIDSYWTVVAAAYSTAQEAEQHAAYARRVWALKDSFVRKLPPNAISKPRPYAVYLPSVALTEYPNFISPPAPASAPEQSHFVFVGDAPKQEDAEKLAADIRRRFPGLNIALFAPRVAGDPWRTALAAHATAEQAQRALLLARRLNLAEAPFQLSLNAPDVLAWRPSDQYLMAKAQEFRQRVEACFQDGSVTMGDMRACAGAWVTPQALTACLGNSNTPEKNMPPLAEAEACVAIPDTVEGALLLGRRGLSAKTELKLEVSNYYKLTNAVLKSCIAQAAGDPTRLQQCLLPKLFTPDQKAAVDCMSKGSADAIQTCLSKAAVAMTGPAGEQAQQTLKCMASSDGTLNAVAGCLPAADKQALERMQRLQQCTAQAASEKDFTRCVGEVNLPSDARAKCILDAGRDPEKLKACAIKEVAGGQEVLDLSTCVVKAGKDPAALSQCMAGVTGSLPAAIASCLTAAGSSTARIQECLVKSDARFAAAQKLQTCVQRAKGDPAALLRTCTSGLLPDASQNLAVCLLTKGGDPKAALAGCGSLPPDAAEVVETVTCLQAAGSNSTRMTECLVHNRPNYLAALETATCVANAGGDSSKLAACAAARVGGTAGAVTQCLAAQPANSRDPLKCVGSVDPRLADAQKVYNCVQKASNVGSAIAACSDGILDQKTQQALDCVSRANGDRAAIAACAGQAILPGEAGRLAGCAASSQGPTSFGVCAVAPSVNEEWRIAGECAVSTGGEPISFASCTGGRLTIRELTKCIGGKIGEDCFGPNNTIRKYYENMFNDLTKGPGPNNEIVKAVGNIVNDVTKGPGPNNELVKAGKAIGDGIHNAGKAIGDGIHNAGQAIGDGIHKIGCGLFGGC